jgi:hypothetical protein
MTRERLCILGSRFGELGAIMNGSPVPAAAPWVAFAAALLSAGQAWAQFVPDEVEVCPAAARVLDPEFDARTQQMVFHQGRSSVRVAPVLPDGSIGGKDCAGTQVARSATLSVEGLSCKNGPEWATSARGTEVMFTKLGRDGRPALSRAWFDGSWQQEVLPFSKGRGLALASSDEDDPEPKLVYVRSLSTDLYELASRDAGQPGTERPVPGLIDPATCGAPRWIPGRRALSFAVPDAAGVRQAVIHDVDSGQLQFLTDDPGHKDEVWVWPAPEFGGDLAMLTVVDGCCLRLYREAPGAWQLYREIKATDFTPKPALYSPEVLVWEGRSHVVVQASNQRSGRSEIWMLQLAQGTDPVQLSDPARTDLNRGEPEWFAGVDQVFVYVTASTEGSRFALHRLRTPLAAAPR